MRSRLLAATVFLWFGAVCAFVLAFTVDEDTVFDLSWWQWVVFVLGLSSALVGVWLVVAVIVARQHHRG